MALRRIYTIDKPAENRILRAKAKKVSRFDAHLQKLVDDMWETMRAAPGVGLAAPQIGESIRVLVAEYEDDHVALVNPEILKRSDVIAYGTEGCLSIPGVVGDDVPRSDAITVKGRDPRGKEIRVKAEGWFARVLQHEIDHLDGILFTDHIPASKVREVRPDEQVDEAEVERVETVKSGKNGATERVARPERDVRLAPEGAATPATAEVRQHPAISATADEPSAKSATAAGASTSSWGRRPAGQAQPSSETAATPATTGGVNGTEKPATSATAGAGTARGKR